MSWAELNAGRQRVCQAICGKSSRCVWTLIMHTIRFYGSCYIIWCLCQVIVVVAIPYAIVHAQKHVRDRSRSNGSLKIISIPTTYPCVIFPKTSAQLFFPSTSSSRFNDVGGTRSANLCNIPLYINRYNIQLHLLIDVMLWMRQHIAHGKYKYM